MCLNLAGFRSKCRHIAHANSGEKKRAELAVDMSVLSLWCLDSELTAGAGKRTCLSLESDEDVETKSGQIHGHRNPLFGS